MRFFILVATIFFLSQFWSSNGQAQVWVDRNSWDASWEKKFETWVKENWNINFFNQQTLADGRENPFLGLRTDCADTVYSMRIIFSYLHALPFVANDPTGGKGLISNQMTRWNGLGSEKQKIRQFMLFAYDAFSTLSLPSDTYPVAIDRRFIHAGGLMMATAKNHHSWTIQDLLPIGVPHLIFNSRVGASSAAVLMERTSWPTAEWVFEGNFAPAGNAGLRYWRQAQDLQKPVWEVPGYSEEQYRIPMSRWVDVVQSKLALSDESAQARIQRLMESVCAGMKGRVPTVQEGVQYLKQVGARCLSYEEYDLYSTPSRDHRVFDDLITLRKSYRKLVEEHEDRALSSDLQRQMKKIFPQISSPVATEQAQMRPVENSEDSACVINYLPGRRMDMAEYRRRAFAGRLSNNPNHRAEIRWGDATNEKDQCPSWDNWQPDLTKEN